MPTFVLYTNLAKEKFPENFLLDTSKFIAQRLGKPEQYVTVRIHPDQMMSHGGSTDPCASLELYSIGQLGERNPEHAKEIVAYIEEKLGISKDRFYITFVDLDPATIALGGKTFKDIFAGRK